MKRRKKNHKTIAISASLPMPVGHENAKERESNAQAQAGEEKSPKPSDGGGKAYKMFVVLSVIFLGILFFVALGFAFHYYGKNATYALWWGAASAILAVLGIAFYIQGYVLQPQPSPVPKERPFVFFKYAALEAPLAENKDSAVTLIVKNSSQSMEADVTIKDATSYFESSDRRGPRPSYATTPPNTFKLAPTAEVNGRIKIPASGLYLTATNIKDVVEGRANLYFFARGEYKDENGRVWPLPFCRMYADDFPGKLINCPDGFDIEQEAEAGDGIPAAQPYLGVTLKVITLAVNKPIQVELILENTGSVPTVAQGEIMISLDQAKPSDTDYRDSEPLSPVTVLPHSQRSQEFIANLKLTSAQLTQIKGGKLFLVVYGRGAYSGVGKTFPIAFYSCYNPNVQYFVDCVPPAK